VSDHRMPEMTGVEFLTRVKQMCPDTTRVLLTGYADMNAAIDAINHGEVHRFMSKPWDDNELRRVIDQSVERFKLIQENKRLQILTAAQNDKLQEWNEKLEERIQERTEELARLLDQVKVSFVNSINIFSGLLEAYDQKLGSHSIRVAELAKGIAANIGLSADYVQIVAIAAQLHDIGQIGIPKRIINAKEEDLTPEERQLLRRHTILGEELVNFGDHFEKVGRLIRAHHENYDGSGYPDAISGTAIPIGARIIAIANAYDEATTLDGHEHADRRQAMQTILAGSGHLFDPELMPAFVKCVGQDSAHKGVELQVELGSLMPGMILARDIQSASGQVLLGSGRPLRSFDIARLKNFNRIWGLAPFVQIIGQ